MAAFTAEDLKRIETADKPVLPTASPAQRQNLNELAEALAGQTAAPAYSPVVVSGLVRLADFLIAAATGFVVQALYVAPSQYLTWQYATIILAMSALTVVVFQIVGIYSISAFRAPVQSGLRLLTAWAFVFVAVLAVLFFIKVEGVFSRVWLGSWFAAGVVCLLISRWAISFAVRSLTRAGRLERRTVIVGGGPAGEELLHDLARQRDTDLRICGVFDDRTDDRSPDVVAGYPKLGNVDDLVAFARHTRIDLVVFTLPITAEQRLLTMLRKLWVLPIDIRLSAHTNKLRFRPRSYSYIGNVPVLDVFDKPIADWDVVLKQAFDRIVGLICLILLSPVMLAVAIAVKLDSKGPVFFKQKRHGFNNEEINIFKFRSMYTDMLDHDVKKQVTRDDPRVTRVGRFIRKTSLDELPQLLNVVFSGNLSLVGPRPHAMQAKAADRAYDEVVDGYFARHRVRPGITGWAQVNGWRGETDTNEKIQHRVEHDLYYIENWSLLFDLYILMITPFALLKTENAY